MSDPTVQSLADQIQALAAQVQALTARVSVHATNINQLSELSRTFSSQLADLESGKLDGSRVFEISADEDMTHTAVGPGRQLDIIPGTGLVAAVVHGELKVHSNLILRNGRALVDDFNQLVINFHGDYGDGTVVDSNLIVNGGLSVNQITAPAGQLFLHTSDLILNGRTSGNGRALVDEGNQLFINFHGDYGDGTVVDSNLIVTGTMQTSGGDIAEQFDVAADASLDPGSVMVVGDDGKLEPCTRGNDSRVAGVVAGAGGLKTAILLNEQTGHRAAIALVGSAYCKCDAAYGSIAAGDLLTTSASAGHAMRTDAANVRVGAVIGKALKPLASGTGLIPILIAPR